MRGRILACRQSYLLLAALAALASCVGQGDGTGQPPPGTDQDAATVADGGGQGSDGHYQWRDGGGQGSDGHYQWRDGGQPQSPDAASAFSCSGAGIGAFADQLVNRARQTCTSAGVGVVTNTNFACLQGPIYDLAPPYPAAAYERVTYWAANGNNYAGKTPLFQCVDFAFVVTAGVCGQPINNGDAQIWENQQYAGYTYMNRTPGGALAGDVLLMDGHIALTAQVLNANSIRIAEANCLNPDGSMNGMSDTGVVSNTRTSTLADTWIIGWYRRQ